MINYTNLAKSKAKWAEALAIIDEAFYSKCGDGIYFDFYANDLGLSGSTCSTLVFNGLLTIVGQTEYWYKVDNDTMKKGTKNIYRYYPVSVDFVKGQVKLVKKKEIQKRILRLEKALYIAYKELDRIR